MMAGEGISLHAMIAIMCSILPKVTPLFIVNVWHLLSIIQRPGKSTKNMLGVCIENRNSVT